MAKHVIVWTALCGLMVGIMLSGARQGVQAEDVTGTLGERQWHHEEEFAATDLRAQPHEVVILHLEPGAKDGKLMRNTIPYLFTETAPFKFCVPQEDPHIRALHLVREGSHGVVVHVPRGAPCKTRTIAAGLYQVVVDHDGEDIPAEGKKAFVHVPRLYLEGGLRAASGARASRASSWRPGPRASAPRHRSRSCARPG